MTYLVLLDVMKEWLFEILDDVMKEWLLETLDDVMTDADSDVLPLLAVAELLETEGTALELIGTDVKVELENELLDTGAGLPDVASTDEAEPEGTRLEVTDDVEPGGTRLELVGWDRAVELMIVLLDTGAMLLEAGVPDEEIGLTSILLDTEGRPLDVVKMDEVEPEGTGLEVVGRFDEVGLADGLLLLEPEGMILVEGRADTDILTLLGAEGAALEVVGMMDEGGPDGIRLDVEGKDGEIELANVLLPIEIEDTEETLLEIGDRIDELLSLETEGIILDVVGKSDGLLLETEGTILEVGGKFDGLLPLGTEGTILDVVGKSDGLILET
ncbi:hypothetical protein VMCG_08028 [Cytospora schulzeri]|uniref:Uncharacterized protein n=1 Tax=Cytospora schulzeri TaxID=448051 RepID=A0A423VY05_9PEZI|nr:hypothetical protein VMCG_08028 [Valsa malicola]